jgi:hypothetical protein
MDDRHQLLLTLYHPSWWRLLGNRVWNVEHSKILVFT